MTAAANHRRWMRGIVTGAVTVAVFGAVLLWRHHLGVWAVGGDSLAVTLLGATLFRARRILWLSVALALLIFATPFVFVAMVDRNAAILVMLGGLLLPVVLALLATATAARSAASRATVTQPPTGGSP